MATFSLTINGVERELQVDGFDIRASLNGPDTLVGDFISADASFRPAKRDEIIFTMDAVRKFAGFIIGVRERGVDGPGGDGGDGIVTTITAEDYSGQVRRRNITITIPAGQTIKQALEAIVAAAEFDGITLAAGQATGPTLAQPFVFSSTRVSEALDAVVVVANELDSTGWYWRINYNAELQAFAPSSVVAPFNLIEGDGTECGDVEVEDSESEDYANRVTVDGGTIVVNGHTECFVADGISDIYQLEYTPLQWWVVDVDTIYHETIGTSPAMWTLDPVTRLIERVDTRPGYYPQPLPAGTPVCITFNGQLEIRATASIGTAAASPPTDVWEKVVAVDGLTSNAQALARAQALVARFSASNRLARYPTDRSGLAPGQVQTLTSAKRNLSGSWLIRDVRTVYHGAAGTDGLRYEVVATEGGVVKGDFRDTYRQWSEGVGVASTATAEANGTLATPGGANTEVQFNDGGTFGGDAGLTYNKTTKAATVTGTDFETIARGVSGGSSYGTSPWVFPAGLVAKVTNQTSKHVQAWMNTVAGITKALVLFMYNTGEVLLRSHAKMLIEAAGNSQLWLAATNDMRVFAGDAGEVNHISMESLTNFYGLSMKGVVITSTTHTLTAIATPSVTYFYTPSANATVNLYATSAHAAVPVSGASGRVYIFVNKSTTYTVTIDPNASELIWNGGVSATTLVLQPGQSVALQVYTDGGLTNNGWHIVASHGFTSAITAHATTHESGGSDAIKLDNLAAPDDNTDLNASTSAHGLLKKLSGSSADVLDGTGNWNNAIGGSGSGNSTDTTLFGSEPAGSPGPISGDLDLYSNSFYLSRYSGSAWLPWGPIYALTPPVNGDFAWVNQGSSSVDTTNGGIALVGAATGAGANLVLRVKTAPSTPYVITACIETVMFHKAFQAFGLCFRQSSDGKLHVLDVIATDLGLTVLSVGSSKYTTATAYSADYQLTKIAGLIRWLRIADNGTNRICSISADGQHWIQVHSIGRTDFLTANQVGFFVGTENSATPNFAPIATLLSWKET